MSITRQLVCEETLPGFMIGAVGSDAWPCFILNESSPEGEPDTIIKNDQEWTVDFRWNCSGATSNAMGPFDWRLSVFLLCLSGGGGVTWSRSENVPYATGTPGADDYTHRMIIPAGAVPDGMYRLFTSVDVEDTAAIVPVTMDGEGPIMKFYTP